MSKPLNESPPIRTSIRLIPVFLTGLIFSFVPLGRSIQALGTAHPILLGSAALLVLCSSLYFFRNSLRSPRPAWLLSALIICSLGYYFAAAYIELVHLPLFAVLGISIRICWGASFSKTLAVCVLAGIADEFLQYLHPDRFFDLRDIAYNSAGGLLGALKYSRS